MEIRKSTYQSKKTPDVNILKNKKQTVSKIAAKRQKKKKGRKVLFIAALVILPVLFVIFVNLPYTHINTIQITGVRTLEEKQKIEEVVNNYLSKKRLLVLPNKSFIVLSSKSLNKEVVQNRSGVESLKSSLAGLHNLNITIKERDPLFELEDNPNIFVDVHGTVYEDNFFDRNASTTTLFINESEYSVSDGEQVGLPVGILANVGKNVDIEKLETIIFYVRELSKKGFVIYHITIHPYDDVTFDITNNGGEVRVNLKDNRQEVVDIFTAAKKLEPLRSELQTKIDSLDYIDLRFGNKVFFKFYQNEQ